MSAHHLMSFFKRTSPNVYEADIFNCSRQENIGHRSLVAAEKGGV